MNRQDFANYKIPAEPGVYLFKKGREILYIGKATSLRTRVRSYFDARLFLTRGPMVEKMVAEADALEWTVVDSVLEALILEARLIKKYQPEGNTMQKDDKSFLFVTITTDSFPQVITERGHGTYGPFTSPTSLREALRIIRRIFPFSTHATPHNFSRPTSKVVGRLKKQMGMHLDAPLPHASLEVSRPGKSKRGCFEYQIGLCPGTCIGVVDRADYRKTVNKIKLLFEGNKARVVSELRKEMLAASKAENFEKAAKCKQQLSALEHIRDTSLIKDESGELRKASGFRIEAYDIAHLGGSATVGVMTVVEDGQLKKSAYRKFKIKGPDVYFEKSGSGSASEERRETDRVAVDDIKHLREVLRRRLGHLEWPLPNLIVVDGGLPQKHAAEALLEERGFQIEVAAVLKDERHKPKEVVGQKGTAQKYAKDILLANSEAHRFAIAFHRSSSRKKLLQK